MHTKSDSAYGSGYVKGYIDALLGKDPKIPLKVDNTLTFVDYCTSCGEPIPEGRMICPLCESITKNWSEDVRI